MFFSEPSQPAEEPSAQTQEVPDEKTPNEKTPNEEQVQVRMYSINGGPVIVDDLNGKLVKEVPTVDNSPLPKEVVEATSIFVNGMNVPLAASPIFRELYK